MIGDRTYQSGFWLRRAWHAVAGAFDSYETRVECALIASLSLTLAVVHVPFGSDSNVVGWYVANKSERIAVELVEAPTERKDTEGAPITRIEQNVRDDPPDEGASTDHDDAPPLPDVTEVQKPLERLAGRKVLDFAQTMPQIIGGVGAYYIHINYPQEAVEAGIEGRLVLGFVVDTDGRTDEIEVVEPLHPACDSAAVQALRVTRFVPGRQDGKTVPVRMRLPVRFKLVRSGGPDSTRTADL